MDHSRSPAYLIMACLAALMLGGCEAMSKEECLSADWYQDGYKDGRAGLERSRIESISESCAKVGVVPDRELYFSGRDTGLREYCSPNNAFSLGINGSYYNAVCPPEAAPMFESYFNEGHRIYETRQRLAALERERHELERQLADASTDKDKERIRDKLEILDDRLHAARDKLRFIENESRIHVPVP